MSMHEDPFGFHIMCIVLRFVQGEYLHTYICVCVLGCPFLGLGFAEANRTTLLFASPHLPPVGFGRMGATSASSASPT